MKNWVSKSDTVSNFCQVKFIFLLHLKKIMLNCNWKSLEKDSKLKFKSVRTKLSPLNPSKRCQFSRSRKTKDIWWRWKIVLFILPSPFKIHLLNHHYHFMKEARVKNGKILFFSSIIRFFSNDEDEKGKKTNLIWKPEMKTPVISVLIFHSRARWFARQSSTKPASQLKAPLVKQSSSFCCCSA